MRESERGPAREGVLEEETEKDREGEHSENERDGDRESLGGMGEGGH